MKELVLMRHAKAVPHTVAQGDHGRPLNGRGHRAADRGQLKQYLAAVSAVATVP